MFVLLKELYMKQLEQKKLQRFFPFWVKDTIELKNGNNVQ